jgi:hypothetical protein
MSHGKIINGMKYMALQYSHDFKKISLNDHIYFTLRDIFINSESYDIILQAKSYIDIIIDSIRFYERTPQFEYTNALCKNQYVKSLLSWLNQITENSFEFIDETRDNNNHDSDSDSNSNSIEYIPFHEWWEQFENLKQMLNTRLSELALESTRQLWIPRDLDYEIHNTHRL